jgi:hypothetical protein
MFRAAGVRDLEQIEIAGDRGLWRRTTDPKPARQLHSRR